MVKLVKFFGYLLFFVAAVLFFLPKEQLYYLAEQELQSFNVVLDKESVSARPFGLKLEDAEVIVQGIEGAVLREMHFDTYLFYSSFTLKDLTLSSAAKSFVPLKVESINASHAFWNPLFVEFDAQGEFGSLYGQVDLLERKVQLHLQPSKQMQQSFKHTLRYLKKDQNGEYNYEKAL